MKFQNSAELHFTLPLLGYLYSLIGLVLYQSIKFHTCTPWKEPLDLSKFPGIESGEMRLSIVSIVQEYIQSLTQAIYYRYTIIGLLISIGIFLFTYFTTKKLKNTILACIGIIIATISFLIAIF